MPLATVPRYRLDGDNLRFGLNRPKIPFYFLAIRFIILMISHHLSPAPWGINVHLSDASAHVSGNHIELCLDMFSQCLHCILERLMQTDNFHHFQGSLQMCVGGADAKSPATKVTSNGSIDVAFLDLLCTADIVILLCIGL